MQCYFFKYFLRIFIQFDGFSEQHHVALKTRQIVKKNPKKILEEIALHQFQDDDQENSKEFIPREIFQVFGGNICKCRHYIMTWQTNSYQWNFSRMKFFCSGELCRR